MASVVGVLLLTTQRRSDQPVTTGVPDPAPMIGDPDAVNVLPRDLPAGLTLRVAAQQEPPEPTALTVTGTLDADGRSPASVTAIEQVEGREFVPDQPPTATVNTRPAIVAARDLQLGLPVIGIDGLAERRVAVLGRGVDPETLRKAAEGLSWVDGRLTFDPASLPAGFTVLYSGTTAADLLVHRPSTVLEYDREPSSHARLRISAARDPSFNPRALIWYFSDGRVVTVDGEEALRIDSYNEMIQAHAGGLVVAVEIYGDVGTTPEALLRDLSSVPADAWARAASQATGRSEQTAVGTTTPP